MLYVFSKGGKKEKPTSVGNPFSFYSIRLFVHTLGNIVSVRKFAFPSGKQSGCNLEDPETCGQKSVQIKEMLLSFQHWLHAQISLDASRLE